MEYPPGFPSRFRPRLDAAVLGSFYKFPNDIPKRVDEAVSVYVDIACGAIETGEWDFALAYSGLSDFARQLCEDHAQEIHPGGMVVKWEWDQYIASLMWQITKSVEWYPHVNRFAKLSKAQLDAMEQPRSYPPNAKEEPLPRAQDTSKAELIERRSKLLAEYKAATLNPSNKKIYEARRSGIHKPQFYQWLNGELAESSATTINFETFLREKRPPIPRRTEE